MQIPKIIYGTAWKKEKTCDLVVKAVLNGFRAVDTAGQPKHYFEPGVGQALKILEKEHQISRESLFIQTKFSPSGGQDPAHIPYDPMKPIPSQVAESFLSSQKYLGTNYVDSLLLHSPLRTMEQTLEAWQAMEKVYDQKGALSLGISNCYDLEDLKTLFEEAQIKPTYLQNRFYADTGYDQKLRAWCSQNGITYQSFWTLTANPHILNHPTLVEIAQKYNKTRPQVFFRLVSHLGIAPLTGTQSEQHMQEDLKAFEFDLLSGEIAQIEHILKNIDGRLF